MTKKISLALAYYWFFFDLREQIFSKWCKVKFQNRPALLQYYIYIRLYLFYKKKRKQNNRWDPKNCRIGRRLQDILKWSWNPGNCVMETEPFATIKLIFKIQGKTICFITPSNTHTISRMSSSFSRVLWVSLYLSIYLRQEV